MIQRHRAHDIWATGKRNDADAIVWASFDKFACDFANRVHARRFLAADREVFRQHRTGNVQHEHDVNSASLDLCEALAELRAREGNHQECQRQQQQRPQDFTGSRGALSSDRSQTRCRRIRQRCSRPAFPAQPRKQRYRQ